MLAALFKNRPFQVPREAVLLHGTWPELWEAKWNATRNRL